MRLSTLAGIVVLLGLSSACETAREEGADADETTGVGTAPPTAPGGGLGGVADDSIVRLQVEDYQTHLDKVIREYRFCVRATSLEIDDGSAAPETIVDRAQRRCEDEFRSVHRTANLIGRLDQIESLRAESQAAALESVVAARASS